MGRSNEHEWTQAATPEESAAPVSPSEASSVSRRRFLSLAAASAALAGAAGCSPAPEDTIVPYTKKPTEVIPGVADYYASTFQEGLVPYSVLVKAREGRPIHIDGNDEHPVFNGKTLPRVQAEIIGLYSPERLREPRVHGKTASWKAAQAQVVSRLKQAAADNKPVLLLTRAVISPTCKAVIRDMQKVLPGLKHVEWEPALGLSDRVAGQVLYGAAATPRYRIDRAKVIVSFEADFLGTMGNTIEAVAGFAANRKLDRPSDPMSRLYACESSLSITGSKADVRIPLRPSGAARLAFAVARALHTEHRLALPTGLSLDDLAAFGADVARRYGVEPAIFSSLVADLAHAGSQGLVLAGPSLPAEAHAAVALLNSMLGAEGNTVETASLDASQLASPADMAKLTRELAAGSYAAAIFWETNPSYSVSDAEAFGSALAKVPLTIALALEDDETARKCDVVLPVHHWLESWNDFEHSSEMLGLQQPLIRPLYDTRQAEEVLLGWSKQLTRTAPVQTDYRKYLMARWQREVYPKGTLADFSHFWVAAVHDGLLRRTAAPRPKRQLEAGAIAGAARQVAKAKALTGMELLLEPDPRLWDGRYANIGWLQELPHPISKVCWGNYLALSGADARRLGVSDGDMVSVAVGRRSVALPVLVQPGQAAGTAFAALGHGRTGDIAGGRGANLFPLVASDGSTPFHRSNVRISRLNSRQPLVRSQTEFNLHGRDIVRFWSLAEYRKNAKVVEKPRKLPTLNRNLEWPEHKWAMAVDLSACTGCAACQIACQSENNIAVVGPERVARGRIMHWVHSDVYYVGKLENPQVAHSVGMCQQCDDAPCEPVCPVAATVHSDDGLNEQVYNRCIGVRYCAANCPYMSRRFNFFDYTSNIKDPLDLAFNPEVTVRPRGVMEKCTFCVQRIRNGVQVAKDEGRALRDGEVRPACAVACPADAIVFGDLQDPDSRVSKLSRSDRGFKMLEELGVRPNITYMAELKNPV